jgi:glycosyltransferase involved in cell wall biosynthesis
MTSVLICSFAESKYLQQTLLSLETTLKGKDYELLVDVEKVATGLVNTPKRFQALWEKSVGDICVKSDDDIFYYPGWLDACLKALRADPNIGYVSPLNHHLIQRKDMFVSGPIGGAGFSPEAFVSGGVWVFRRDLWKVVPYGNLNGIKTLDSNYGAAVRQIKLYPAYLNGVLCSHLGFNRHSGVESA